MQLYLPDSLMPSNVKSNVWMFTGPGDSFYLHLTPSTFTLSRHLGEKSSKPSETRKYAQTFASTRLRSELHWFTAFPTLQKLSLSLMLKKKGKKHDYRVRWKSYNLSFRSEPQARSAGGSQHPQRARGDEDESKRGAKTSCGFISGPEFLSDHCSTGQIPSCRL